MASSIDATKPTAGAALTADVRNNFSAAKSEIEALQAADATLAPKGAVTSSGLTMSTGKLAGRTTAGTGAIEEISVAGKLSLTGGVLTGTGGDFKSDGTVAGTGNFTTTGSMRADGGFSVNDDTLLQRVSAANWRLGAADASAPVAQTLSVQNVIAGTSNTAGADRTYLGSASTGNAVGGGHVFKTTPAGSSGSAQNSQATAMTIAGSGNVGIGQTTPTAGLHIDTAARSATGLKIRTALGQDLFNCLKPDGNSLLRAFWDGSTIYYYYSGTLYVNSGNVGLANPSPGEKLDVSGNIKSSGFQRTTPVTVATLSAAATAGAGARHFVTDSTVAASGNFGAAVTGGGSNIVPVYSDGTSWRIG